MRVLFLDFDGILHPGPDVDFSFDHWCWLPTLAQLLEPHEDVRIVVHSTWRLDHSVDELRELLGPLGTRVIDATPEGGRFESIERWLDDHSELSSYRFLDDDPREFFYPLPSELIVCDTERGIRDPAARRELVAWLGDR